MYRNLCDIYLIFADYVIEERQRFVNIFSITLKSYSFKLNDVVRIIQKDYIALKKKCKFLISKKKVNICISILIYTENMKSQQKVVGFLGPKANLFCRMYHTSKINRDNMNLDIVQKKRYYYKILFVKKKENVLPTQNKRQKKNSAQNMLQEFSALQIITFVLDLIHNRLDDSAHNEFADIIRYIISMLCEKILIKKVLKTFTKKLRDFLFLFE